MTKVSELNQVNVLKDDSLLMAVQDGESVKFQASLLQKANVSAANADAVGGIPAASIATKSPDGTLNADALGGVSAQALLERIRILESKLATRDDDPAWCRPIPWFSMQYLPANDGSWAFCDGRQLAIAEYRDLFAIIGNRFTRKETGSLIETSTYFNLPDLRGRMILGIHNRFKTTINLPRPINGNYEGCYYSTYGKTINEQGQWMYPDEVGMVGGDPTCAMSSVRQMPRHKHESVDGCKVGILSDNKLDIGRREDPCRPDFEYKETGPTGFNYTYRTEYPGNEKAESDDSGNVTAMLSISPYVAFAWVMRIRR